ncbi:MAG: bifunctional 5,10-methylene-tetrahydrofolate dehydrogenase/5,10-methylene-tetrahydrofolate cyclohydrolase [Chlamydiae bacterium RIFCSPHIGHO2_12_FULL_44_59]|nr:MAG: bifunctional 5,10-methylene-tetrahydrofolate dehydrogenase/5,10-methylene-tetrahydrofolate cyclohydrolase [Chlamydiae bacterium RIFCSPHIGHO2_01_FULL_44_39]OGN59874.1 MAG: bifunctional 5,10-methylene-tetrahydrofolate dehydrogenase/5,10-methylene-tetrahydrofolate cyclohydrolase [Chlamydiae bacterium RIFCSPHIGHO2_12_FULL_44_59]OGN66081.1 MAG: bifunctional 5,10-methylene-tetrahydrofolate dehydrogenase/5,10-methylene-tetrahydrofolate cyclohydrolase [Chlamydiae bacterium RIFCSPLOWO2_01_FULL_44_
MILDGKKIALSFQEAMREKISSFSGRKPGLTMVLVGENPASLSYVQAKKKACLNVGIVSEIITLPPTLSERDLILAIDQLNREPSVDGILVQLPLPPHINPQRIMFAIDPRKDVDGFHPVNIGKLLLGHDDGFIPCTPLGVKTLLESYRIPIQGKHVVIVGRSDIVGKPLAALLMQKKEGCNATVTVTHSQTEHLFDITRSADILVAALGRPQSIRKEMIKPQAVVVDVGINRVNGKLVGDVDFEDVQTKASAITPVPGGIGPMTIAMLLQNTLLAFS